HSAGFAVRWDIAHRLGEGGVSVGAYREGDEFHRRLLVGGALEHGEILGDVDALLERVVDRTALGLRVLDATAVDGAEIDPAGLHQGERLRGFIDPLRDVRLDLVEGLEAALDVERIELRRLDAIGEERKLQHLTDAGAQAAAAGKSRDVPELLEVLWMLACG